MSNNGSKPIPSPQEISIAPGDTYVLAVMPIGSTELQITCSDVPALSLLTLALAIVGQAHKMLVEQANNSRIICPK